MNCIPLPAAELSEYTSIEICAGAGGQALGLAEAGFKHVALFEVDKDACSTLRENSDWNVIPPEEANIRTYDFTKIQDRIDLLAGGVPCPPYSIAGRQLGREDDRDLLPQVLRIAAQINPRAIMIENVKGLLQKKFEHYRDEILLELEKLGYRGDWRLVNARDFGVAQTRTRSVLVALRKREMPFFSWPEPTQSAVTVGEALLESMASEGWEKAEAWAQRANGIAPTLVGGSKKHGGADLGPTRAKAAWKELGVDAHGVADKLPGPGFAGNPRLTVAQAAILQGFPPQWKIMGRKTSAYRQVGNAFPPPVAKAIGEAIVAAWRAREEAYKRQHPPHRKRAKA